MSDGVQIIVSLDCDVLCSVKETSFSQEIIGDDAL